MKTCEKCLGTGTERTIVHGIESNGEACIEPIKCDSCDGFGTDRNMKPSELLELCMEFNAPDFHVFFSYYGHTGTFSLSICKGGWIKDKTSEYFDMNFSHSGIQDAADWLRKQHEEFRSKQ